MRTEQVLMVKNDYFRTGDTKRTSPALVRRLPPSQDDRPCPATPALEEKFIIVTEIFERGFTHHRTGCRSPFLIPYPKLTRVTSSNRLRLSQM